LAGPKPQSGVGRLAHTGEKKPPDPREGWKPPGRNRLSGFGSRQPGRPQPQAQGGAPDTDQLGLTFSYSAVFSYHRILLQEETMPNISLSLSAFERLQRHAKPFVDTPESVILRALDALEQQTGQPVPDASADGSPEREIDARALP